MDPVVPATVYVLRCEMGKYYVGKTSKPVWHRFLEHRDGRGAEWTKRYRPMEIIQVKETTNPFEETGATLFCMQEHGIGNVRGGPFSRVTLDEPTIHQIENILAAIQDRCFRCKDGGHFQRSCPNRGSSSSGEPPSAGSDDDNDEGQSFWQAFRNPHLERFFKCAAKVGLTYLAAKYLPGHSYALRSAVFAGLAFWFGDGFSCEGEFSDSTPPRSSRKRHRSNSRCFRCGSESHWAADCNRHKRR